MYSNYLDIFDDGHVGAELYAKACLAVSDFSMDTAFKKGVLVGLSGGADSVLLLLFLLKYRQKNFDFPIVAVHVNHMIRGDEADRDDNFSKELCRALGVEFISRKIDVPTLAKEKGKSLEEAARNARYSVFSDIISGRSDVSTTAVAHNADDNAETLLINMIRGTGTRGMCGIAPVRDGIVRPLIYIEKSQILKALSEEKINFVNDSTNDSDDYTRNYIRHNVISAIKRIAPDFTASVKKLCANLREDDDCLDSLALSFKEKYENGRIPKEQLAGLHPALFFRVLKHYFSDLSRTSLERVHVDAIRHAICGNGDFTISVPEGLSFVLSSGMCGFAAPQLQSNQEFNIPIFSGENQIEDFSAKITVSKSKCAETSSKIYNNSTQANLRSAIIVGDLFVRNKRDGDSYLYGGMTRKLKKLFCDRKIPNNLRSRIPVLCDDAGIVWVPGFGVRDDGGNEDLYVEITVTSDSDKGFYLPKTQAQLTKKGKMVT